MPSYRPGPLLLTVWVGTSGLVGAATGLVVAWYGGLLWVLVSLSRGQQTPGSAPPDVLERVLAWLRPGVVPFVLLGVVAGMAIAAHRAAAGDKSRQRWRHRAWQLGGVVAGVLVGASAAVFLVSAWSVLTLGLDPEAPPPPVASQARDGVIFGLLMAVPLAGALIGRWLGPVLGPILAGRADRHEPTT